MLFLNLILFVLRFDLMNSMTLLDYITINNKTIVCFGDSLTHGMYVDKTGEWRNTHPYSIKLNEILNKNTSISHNKVNVVEKGINGENLQQMLGRLPEVLNELQPSIVIILGGTNDLQGKRDASSILVDLMKLHKMCHLFTNKIGETVKTIVVTIPPAAWFDAIQDGTREVVNAQIRNFAKKHLLTTALCDLSASSEFRYVNKESDYWSVDGVHLGIKGYDLFAELIHFTLSKHTIS